MTRLTAPPPWYLVFKLSVFVLLIANAIVFALRGTASERLDSVAWLTLLVLFEFETAYSRRLSTQRSVMVVHAVRLCAGAAVMAAAIGYVHEKAWLDAANTWLWIAVVALLEFEVRFPQAFARHVNSTGTIAAVLYLSLAGLVVVWAWHGEWFDAYDAALWIVAFVTIELNVLTRSGRHCGLNNQ